jgi:hypothetical protein
MSGSRWRAGAFVLALIGLVILAGGRAMAVEEPAYRTVLKDGAFEVREYPRLLAAEVTVPGGQRDAASRGFRLLAGYIFGGNAGERKIAMTAPVAQHPTGETIPMTGPVTQTRDADRWVVRFTMPSTYQTLDSLPKPNDPRVVLREIPPARVAVLRFSGWAWRSDVEAKNGALLAAVAAHHLHATGPVTLAQYNPPWTLWFMRRNELMVALTPE